MRLRYGLCANLRGVALVVVMGGFAACTPDADAVYGEPGAPLPGLDGAELAEFLAGRSCSTRCSLPKRDWGRCSTRTSAARVTRIRRVEARVGQGRRS